MQLDVLYRCHIFLKSVSLSFKSSDVSSDHLIFEYIYQLIITINKTLVA